MWATMCVFLGMVSFAMKLTLNSWAICLDNPMICERIFTYLGLGIENRGDNNGIIVTSYTIHF